MLPARDVNGLINCVKKLRNSKKDNPIKVSTILFNFVKKKCQFICEIIFLALLSNRICS